MHVEVRNLEDVILVDLDGRLVAGVGDQILREIMDELIAEGWQKILLNLSGVSWIDSSGIGELVAGIRLAKRFNCSVKLLRAGDRVKHVLSLSQLLPLLEIYETEEEALERFRAETPSPPPEESGSRRQ